MRTGNGGLLLGQVKTGRPCRRLMDESLAWRLISQPSHTGVRSSACKVSRKGGRNSLSSPAFLFLVRLRNKCVVVDTACTIHSVSLPCDRSTRLSPHGSAGSGSQIQVTRLESLVPASIHPSLSLKPLILTLVQWDGISLKPQGVP